MQGYLPFLQSTDTYYSTTCVDVQDQEDLDEARKISAFNRRRISGDVKMLEDELMNDMHALEVCLSTVVG